MQNTGHANAGCLPLSKRSLIRLDEGIFLYVGLEHSINSRILTMRVFLI